MSAESTILPYRTDGNDLIRLIEARGRGRAIKQIQSLNFTNTGFQGTVAAAYALKLMLPDSDELTETGRELALSRNTERKREILLESMLQYEPYELLLEAVFAHNHTVDETTTEWIETWWSTHNHGNSQKNRNEGATAFCKLLESAGLGNFFIGRRGRPTRIEWQDNVAENIANLRNTFNEDENLPINANEYKHSEPIVDSPDGTNSLPTDKPSIPPTKMERPTTISGNSELTLPLGTGRIAVLSLPPQLTASEKQRLITMVDLMISEVDDDTEQ